MATISLGMIIRNEGRTLQNLLLSVADHVDQIVIGLAGQSTDDTESIIRSWTQGGREIETFDIEWNDDFSEARNQVLERCTGDYFLWLDGDDVLINGNKMQEYIEQYPDIDSFYMGYDYARDEQGHNTCFLIRERLVKRELGWKWKGAIHEVLLPENTPNIMHVTDIVVKHHRPPEKGDPNRNLAVLYRQLEESEPNPDPRVLAYLGTETAGRGNLSEAILHWQRYIKLSGWTEEKYQMTVKISMAYRGLGQFQKSLDFAYQAIAILPEWPDAYYAAAKTYASMENYKAALEWIKIGWSKPTPQTALIINPLEYTYEPSLMTAICYTALGDYEMALENYKQALSFAPDPTVAAQVNLLTAEMDAVKAQQSFLYLREYLGRHDEWIKVRNLFEALPKALEGRREVLEAWDRTMKQTDHIERPEIMETFYQANPHWQSMPEEQFLSTDWLKYPRMAFALSVADRIDAKTIVDWGCSDGFISLPLARESGATITGIDLDPRCVSLANERAVRLGIDAQFFEGNVDESGHETTYKYDLALFFEAIEHVVDPEATLDRLEAQANHIALTTPYLAWEGGNLPDWDRVEPKGHLRIFGLDDIEVLLQTRGKIHNLYKEPWGPTGWIFADYTPGPRDFDKNIVIGAGGSLEKWGPRKLREEGLGGSETAAIRLAEELDQLGHRTFVYTNIDSPGYYNGVCYRDIERLQPNVRSDLFIAWRWPEAADHSINTERLVLWMHDTDAGDRLTPERAARFHSIVVLTDWHRGFMQERYPFLRDDQMVVIGNGVDLSRFTEPVERKPYKVVYSSSPDRGLDIILEHIWPKVTEVVHGAELHVYYGWDSFDRASDIPGWEHLKQFKAKMERLILDNKNVVQHGRVSQDRLAKEMQEAKIWLYPTYFPETYCITAVEAQLAGAVPITNRFAGLSETVKSGIRIDGDVHDPEVQATYAQAVIHALQHPDSFLHDRIIEDAPAVSWAMRALEWNNTFFGEATNGRVRLTNLEDFRGVRRDHETADV